jgi:hypothetical protein
MKFFACNQLIFQKIENIFLEFKEEISFQFEKWPGFLDFSTSIWPFQCIFNNFSVDKVQTFGEICGFVTTIKPVIEFQIGYIFLHSKNGKLAKQVITALYNYLNSLLLAAFLRGAHS